MTKEEEKRIRDAVEFGETQRTGKWFVADLALLLAELDRSRALAEALAEALEACKIGCNRPPLQFLKAEADDLLARWKAAK